MYASPHVMKETMIHSDDCELFAVGADNCAGFDDRDDADATAAHFQTVFPSTHRLILWEHTLLL